MWAKLNPFLESMHISISIWVLHSYYYLPHFTSCLCTGATEWEPDPVQGGWVHWYAGLIGPQGGRSHGACFFILLWINTLVTQTVAPSVSVSPPQHGSGCITQYKAESSTVILCVCVCGPAFTPNCPHKPRNCEQSTAEFYLSPFITPQCESHVVTLETWKFNCLEMFVIVWSVHAAS